MAGFLARFILLYILLVAPWPAAQWAADVYLRRVIENVFGGVHGEREVSFEANPQRSMGTRVVIVNQRLMAPDGSGPVRRVDFDFAPLLLRPLALLLALIFATPVSWRRRAWAALAGVTLLQSSLLALFGYSLWVESAEVALAQLSDSSSAVAAAFEEAAVTQFGMAVPVLIWIVVTLRREDALRIFGRTMALVSTRHPGGAPCSRVATSAALQLSR